jgi:Colicin V production protein
VPQIDTPLLLDILLGLVILLFVPFGIRRGVAKEAMVSAGILLGATLAARFADAWGGELNRRFGLEPGAATFAAAAITLFVCTFLLGYGGGAALGRMRPGTLSRLSGGLLAAFNAALLLSYLLSWIEHDLGQGRALGDGILSRALLRQADLLLLGAAGVLLALTVIGWVVNAGRSHRQPRQRDPYLAGMPVRQRPVRVAEAADAGKHEPDFDAAPRSGRFGQGLDATSPLPATAAYGGQEPWAAESQTLLASNGHGRGGQSDEARRPLDALHGAGDETVWSAWSTRGRDEDTSHIEAASQWPVAPSVGVTDDERCAVCHAPVGPRDVFCPECGATL